MEPIRSTGRLVIVEDPEPWGDEGAAGEFLGPAGARVARAVVVAVGPRGRGRPAAEALGRLGVADVRVVEVAGREDADRPHPVALAERASAVLILGDDPAVVAARLAGTGLDAALRRLARSIAVVAAGPAGPAFGSAVPVAGGEPLDGLGHLPGAILGLGDPRDGRLRAALEARAGSTGLALGPGAALAFDGQAVESRGRGTVVVLSGEAGESLLRPGERLGLPARD